MLIKSRKPSFQGMEVTDLEDDLEQDSSLKSKNTASSGLGSTGSKHQERAQYYLQSADRVWFTKMRKLGAWQDDHWPLLAFSNILAKKRGVSCTESQRLSLRDEYKIEDMMIIVKESLAGRDQLRLQDLFKEAQNVQEVITLFSNPRVNQTQELILVQEESFGDIYLMEKKEESQVAQS